MITDKRLKPDVVKSVEEALKGGAPSIQLRLKDSSTIEMVEIGKEVRKLTREYGALYFVNDRVDVALATDADGVQLGTEDMPIELVREKIAPHLIVGASVHSVEEAIRAQKERAHFLGAGSVYFTSTKPGAKVIGLEGLREIVRSVSLPVVAIGGITAEKVPEVIEAGAIGVAVVSAVMGAPDVRKATRELLDAIEKALLKRYR
ncbi:MAG: thiamine phosphate synthase [Acidilobaceae archaeon]